MVDEEAGILSRAIFIAGRVQRSKQVVVDVVIAPEDHDDNGLGKVLFKLLIADRRF